MVTMEVKSVMAFAIFSIIQIVVAEKLEIHTRLRHSSLPVGYSSGSWYYRNHSIDYSNVHIDRRGEESSKSEIRVEVLKDNFDSNESYNCTYEIDKVDSHYRMSKRDKDGYFVAIEEYTSGTSKWRILKFDLPSCNVVQQKFDLYAEKFSFDYNNSGDIIFVNPTLCGDKYCKMSLDSQLNIVDGPKPWIDVYGDYVLQAEFISPVGAHRISLIRQQDNYMKDRLTLSTEKGLKLLYEKNSSNIIETLVSPSHGVITLMHVSNLHRNNNTTSLDIIRYDFDGNLNLQKHIDITGSLEHADIQNLNNGNFMLIIGNTTEFKFKLHLTKYNERGEAIFSGIDEIEGFEYRNERYRTPFRYPFFDRIIFYKDQNEMLCFAQGRESPNRKCGDESCLDFLEKCFSKSARMEVFLIPFLSALVSIYHFLKFE